MEVVMAQKRDSTKWSKKNIHAKHWLVPYRLLMAFNGYFRADSTLCQHTVILYCGHGRDCKACQGKPCEQNSLAIVKLGKVGIKIRSVTVSFENYSQICLRQSRPPRSEISGRSFAITLSDGAHIMQSKHSHIIT